MMKKICMAIALYCSIVVSVDAGTTRIGAQFGLTQYYTESYGKPADCSQSNPSDVECVQFPGHVVGWTGTVTVKQPRIEILAAVRCGTDNEFLWAGEMFQGTLMLTSPAIVPNNVVSPCWLVWSAVNNGFPTQPGGAWEIQFVIYYE